MLFAAKAAPTKPTQAKPAEISTQHSVLIAQHSAEGNRPALRRRRQLSPAVNKTDGPIFWTPAHPSGSASLYNAPTFAEALTWAG
ncbi:hypothetical protein GCM10027046_20400 [Uliginosibacterium flavum]